MEDLGRLKLFEYTVRLFQDGNQFFENKFKNNVLIIGREDDCDLIIQDRSISRRHLRIEVDIDKFYVTDMGSSNGTFVDNVAIDGKTQITSESHIRAGKITIQVITPEINKKVSLELNEPAVPSEAGAKPTPAPRSSRPVRAKEDPPELTLSKIAIHVEEALAKTDHQEDVMAMVDRDFVVEMTTQHESSANFISKKIESLVLWNQQIYNIQEFGFHDTIVVGPTHDDSIHIPSVPFRWALSTYEFKEAIFQVPKSLNVFAIRGNNFLSKEQLVSEKRIREDQNSIQIQISHYDILRVEIDANTQLYFRYVPSTVNLESKRLLNPDVLIKKALLTSFIMHMVLSLIFFLIPKDKIKPREEKKAPIRLAKLIVEEKPVPPPIVIPPPPPPPEEVKPEPPPPPEVKKAEPKPPPKKAEPPKPKPKPKKELPKPVVKKEPPPRPVEKASQVVQKPVAVQKPMQQMNPVGNNKPAGPAAPKPAPAPPPAPPPPKPVDISKLGALAAMSGLKLDARSTKAAPAINIAANTTNTNTGNSVGINSMTSELKSQTAGTVGGTNASGPIKTKGTGSVASGYGKEGIGTGTGKRGVKGAVAGKPQLSVGSGKTEGLSREQVLKAMQAYLGKIQSCYERSLLSDPNLTGRIEFEWNISSGGSVRTVDIKKNSVAGGESLGECVIGVIKSMKFPAATNGQETNPSVGFPFGRL